MDESAPDNIRKRAFTIDATLAAMRELNREFQEFARSDSRIEAECSPLEELRLAVREAATNIVEHGRVPSPAGGLQVEFSFDGDEFTVRFENAGVAFDPRRALGDPPSPEDLAEGGYGIYLIQTLADAIEYRSTEESNVLTLRKGLRRSRKKAS